MLQMEATECGAASLAIILAYYRRYIPLEELRLACGVSRDGATASNLIKAAREYGLDAKGAQMDLDDLAQLRAPAILFWKFEHFLVWEGNGRRYGRPVAFINDPATGRYTVPMAEFDSAFTGIVLDLKPGLGFQPGGHPPSFLVDLRSRLRGGAGALLIGVLASLLLVAVGIAMPSLTTAIINSILQGGGFTAQVPVLAAIAVGIVMTLALTALQQGYLLRMQLVTSALSHARFLRHVLRIPMSFFSQRGPADVTKRMQANGEVARIATKDTADILVNAVIIIGYASLMWAYDAELAVVGIVVVVLNLIALKVVIRSRESAVAKLSADRTKFYEASFDGLHLIETLKATGGEAGHFQRWAGHQASAVNSQQRLFTPTAVFVTVAPLLGTLASALVLLFGGLRAVDGSIAIGLLVAFQTLIASFTRPVSDLTGVAANVQDLQAEITRIKDVETVPVDNIFNRSEPKHISRLNGHLEFNSVTFGYNPLGEPLISELSFTVGPGQRVSLVGGSGSGKSTTVKLISGLYEQWSGEITLDGRPHAAIPRSVLAASVSFVDQEIYLFEGTVRDNVALWDPSIPDAAVVAALRDAAVYDVVARLPGGIYAKVEQDGRNFSGGQRQRLEIARALVRSPSLLVLDEATSALDSETELVIEDNLRRRGCACVVIAHRLSTVRNSDEIIVLDHGRVVERGVHHELIALDGHYAGLANGRHQ
ncbi:NHLP family bacteriocin export ABC transporter peptidase/permease/ATPase subunit [Lentzea tibetensis]|uniref:NHLP family bacteriocin export ABC transporter peptidase/permease/ATPase subunit n=1 Tax=Lentzea tibetensis TaxID=2591470 RepID=A0A563EEU6_9PSEU|nr:NHLP family bacteriocin export ABC transporter peptidase/permease/ATPase subunit [Lentzea tibetensis]